MIERGNSVNDQTPDHVHAWKPWDDQRPLLVHCADGECPLSARTVEITETGIYLRIIPHDEGSAIPDGLFAAAIGQPPWQVLVHIKAADGTIRAEYHALTLWSMDDTARIEFRLRDWHPKFGAGGTDIAEPPDNPRSRFDAGVGLSAASGPAGMGGGGAGSSNTVRATTSGGAGGGSAGRPPFGSDLARAAAELNADEALRALAAVATAAGVHTATMAASSISEVGDIIVGKIRNLRS